MLGRRPGALRVPKLDPANRVMVVAKRVGYALPREARLVGAILFSCPGCETLFQAPAPGQKCLCPRCGQKLLIPAVASAPAPTGTPDGQGKTILAAPARLIPFDPNRLVRLRVWAAAVRDREAPHAAAPSEAVGLAKMLCELLDARGRLQADNTRDATDVNIALLVGLLILAGLHGPQ
jgi:DNA-directed RNA polymerase subunit RPC12/RpoP